MCALVPAVFVARLPYLQGEFLVLLPALQHFPSCGPGGQLGVREGAMFSESFGGNARTRE